jgi:AcrR family transcriptional regulator
MADLGEPAELGQTEDSPCGGDDDAHCALGRRAGRPLVLGSAARRAYLLEAASAVFMEKGYAASTVEAIAARAGMSKKTVYRVFDSKLALFDALLDDCFFKAPEPEAEECSSLEEGLTRILETISNMLSRPDRAALLRMVIAEGPTTPELTTAFDRLKLNQRMSTLEQWFERQERNGALRVGNVREAARLVFGMTIAGPMMRMLLKAPGAVEEAPMAQSIAQGVRVFLIGLKAGPLPHG